MTLAPCWRYFRCHMKNRSLYNAFCQSIRDRHCLPVTLSRCSPRTVSPLATASARRLSSNRVSASISSVSQALSVTATNSPEQNVDIFSEASESAEREHFISLLVEMCGSAAGLSAVMDMRDQCNTMIRKLPEPRLLKFDKVLFEVLKRTVSFDTTEITTVTKSSPRDILDTVAKSDRVHPIRSEEDLQHRIADNRSVFILTHKLLPRRPLVALHVAHSNGMFQCVSDIKEGKNGSAADTLCRLNDQQGRKDADLLSDTGDLLSDTGDILSCPHFHSTSPYSRVNTFYSISSLEIALRGIPCGGWCISKAKTRLSLPRTVYTTLSPIPGFRNWCNVAVKRSQYNVLSIMGDQTPDIMTVLSTPNHLTQVPALLKPTFSRLAAYYLLKEKQRGAALDPVGHFHLTNGAVVWALRWGGMRSEEMMDQSFGLMVNYLYDGDAGTRAAMYASEEKVVTAGVAVSDLLD